MYIGWFCEYIIYLVLDSDHGNDYTDPKCQRPKMHAIRVLYNTNIGTYIIISDVSSAVVLETDTTGAINLQRIGGGLKLRID